MRREGKGIWEEGKGTKGMGREGEGRGGEAIPTFETVATPMRQSQI